MKKYEILALQMAVLLWSLSGWPAQVEENVNYQGWKCVKLSNQTTEVWIAPAIGGRIIQYAFRGHPFLWTNPELAGKVFPVEENAYMEIWKNYGGDKIWPAPQGWDTQEQWPGPGDVVIEAPYTYEVLKAKGKEVKVRITGSAAGGYAGVQFSREFTLRDGSSRLYLLTTMKNVSDRAVSWGIWSVTQMDFRAKNEKTWNDRARIIIPLNLKSRWPEGFHVMFGQAASFNWKPDYDKRWMVVTYENLVGKIGLDASAGWAVLEDRAANMTFVQRFPYFPGQKYPDDSSFEVWVAGKGEFIHKHALRVAPDDPKGRLIEMEILSPQVTLPPGESYSFPTSWEAHPGRLEQVKDLGKGYDPLPQ
jgi:hypothetical protein